MMVDESVEQGTANANRQDGSLAMAPHKKCRWLVDVAGIEPATPCLQMRFKNAMWLSFLAFTYVVVHGF